MARPPRLTPNYQRTGTITPSRRIGPNVRCLWGVARTESIAFLIDTASPRVQPVFLRKICPLLDL